MLTIQNLNKSYGIKKILTNVSFSIDSGERVGLIGPNGSGKTTLLKLISGDEKPDSGLIRFSADATIGYLPQGFTFAADSTMSSWLFHGIPSEQALTARLEEIAVNFSLNLHQAELQEEYNQILINLQHLSAITDRSLSILGNLGLAAFAPDTPINHLSGGQKTRLALAGILIRQPNLLVLDEPTNHLDIEMLEWLEAWLNGFRGAVLQVSHDRTFLDRTVTTIFELDPVTQNISVYPGNYSNYLEIKAAQHSQQWQEYQDQQVEIRRLRSAAAHTRKLATMHKGGKADSGDKFAAGFFANRSLGTVKRAKHLEQRIEQLSTEEHIDKPARTWDMRIEFQEVAETGKDVLVLEELAIGYDDRPLITNIRHTIRLGQRIALIGPNGCGKSTLIKTITGQLPTLSGSIRFGSHVKVGYIAQEQDTLVPTLNALQTISLQQPWNNTEIRSFLSLYLFKGDLVFTPVQSLSYGERVRLYLALTIANGCNFLILDEPINHLDIPARNQFEKALGTFHGTILAVVHDRYFIQGFATEIWEVRENQITYRERL
jgi:ATP-binding cassette, subfamily F, member 3